MRKLLVFIFLLAAYLGVRAEVRLPAVLASNMVLQQRSHVKFWGWSEPGEKIFITTSWDHRTDSVRGSRDGKWEVLLPTPGAGGPFNIEVRGSNRIVLENVLIGEVWVCAGQSNMEMCETWGLPDVKDELPVCANGNIRLFQLPKATAVYPQEDCKAKWVECDSNALKRFSAVGYFFGKRLNKELNVPIGLVEAAWGGTPAEVWTPAALVNGDSVLKNAAAKQKPSAWWPFMPGYCYNAMIAPLTSLAAAGAIWYQGEGNTEAPQSYSRLFTTMIAAWRKAWGSPLSFYFVQIAPFTYGVKDQGSLLREQQDKSQQMENVGMVVVSDIAGDTTNIHPKDKHDVGWRLANWALADTYHRQNIVFKNPGYRGMQVEGDKVVVSFGETGGGLVVNGPEVKELLVAGEDRVFYPAKGKVEGSRMVVSSKQVKKPVAVRYQWSNAGVGNLSGKSGLPVAPFRTDEWEVVLN
ncbi:MAG: sialate O-acetylesterase [Bacteroidetes bacterium]|nr:sialate O-acetylesterase [Bacteroidota bacterium]